MTWISRLCRRRHWTARADVADALLTLNQAAAQAAAANERLIAVTAELTDPKD